MIDPVRLAGHKVIITMGNGEWSIPIEDARRLSHGIDDCLRGVIKRRWLHVEVAPGTHPEVAPGIVVGTASIFEACRDAASVARDLSVGAAVSVRFVFSGHPLTVGPYDDPDVIARAWWQMVYGEPPEQTMSKR